MTAPTPPKGITVALEALAARRQELAQAQGAHRSAQRDIAAARQRDTEAIAAALDAGRKRPTRQEEARATRASEDASLELEVVAERLKRAGERVADALDTGASEWLKSVEAAWASADQRALVAVEELRAGLVARNELLVLRGHIREVASPTTRDGALARPAPVAGVGVISTYKGFNGDPVPAEEILSGIAEHVEATGIQTIVGRERAERAERERAAQVQAGRDEETRQREEDQGARAPQNDRRRVVAP